MLGIKKCPIALAAALVTTVAIGAPLELTDVFTGGREGYPVYRIPALVTTPTGAVLAFAEGRASRNDQSNNQIVLKRSLDGGRTWGPLLVVASAGAASLNNPTAVIVRETGRVLLMIQLYPEGSRERNVVPGLTGTNICHSLLVQSDDDGATWSKPANVTAQIKRPTGATSLASGPGNGIQLRRGTQAGRILIPFNQGPPGQWAVYAAISDDRGTTWKYGALAPNPGSGQGNEVQMVELADGSIALNARIQGGAKMRKTAVSHDGGESWSDLKDDPNLPDPVCQASFIRHPDRGNPAADVLLFSNPANPYARTNGVIRLSRDEGGTWPVSKVIYPGSFAYSSLTTLPDGTVGCLFERDDYGKISFARFPLEWLTQADR